MSLPDPSRAPGGRAVRWLLLLAALLFAAPALAADAPPVEEAKRPVEALYAALRTAAAGGAGLEERRAQLAPVVGSSFDLEFMAAKVLGRHWRTLSPEQKAEWVELFRRLTVSSYAERFDRAEGLRLEVLGAEEGTRTTAVVRSRIHPPDEDPVEVDYRLRPDGETWRIVDVYLTGTVSELALRRSEYGAVIEREGFQELSESLDEKIRTGRAAGELPRGG